MISSVTPPLNAFEFAGQIGYEKWGELGKKSFEELELCFASSLSPSLSDYIDMRPWINLNFYWEPSYVKSKTIEVFRTLLPDAFLNRDVTSATVETMFGSVNKDGTKIIPPMFIGYQMYFMPEFLTFLGKDFHEKTNVLNKVLEGEEVTRDLIKFGDVAENFVNTYEDQGLHFDGRYLTYRPMTVFVIATHPVDTKIFATLEGKGFWSRFHTVQIRITDSMAREYFTGSGRPSSKSNIESLSVQLKNFNTNLLTSRSRISNVAPSYESILLPVFQSIDKLATEYCEKTDLKLASIISFRVRGDIIREAKAYQILNPTASDDEVKRWLLSRAHHFIAFIVQPELAREARILPLKTKEMCATTLKERFKGQHISRETAQDAMQKEGYSRTTIDRALQTLFKRTNYGEYEIS